MTTDEFAHKMNGIRKDKIYRYQEFLNTFAEALREVMISGERLNLNQVGTFLPVKVKEKKMYLPVKEEVVTIDEHVVIKFNPAIPLKKACNLEKEG